MLVRRLLHALSGRLLVGVITAEVDGREDGRGALFERYLLCSLPRMGRWGGGVAYLHHDLRPDPIPASTITPGTGDSRCRSPAVTTRCAWQGLTSTAHAW